MKEVILKINGMMCEGCENRVKNRLMQESGVEKVEADHNTGKVTIYSNEVLKNEEIENIIIDLGYEVVKEN